jgi:hypothetical protein
MSLNHYRNRAGNRTGRSIGLGYVRRMPEKRPRGQRFDDIQLDIVWSALLALDEARRHASVTAWERIDRGLIARDPPPALLNALKTRQLVPA